MMFPSECSLNKGTGSGTYTDTVVEELQRNFTMLSEKVASLGQAMKTKEEEHNRTIEYQQHIIGDLQRKVKSMERQQNDTIACQKVSVLIEEKINQSLCANKAILHEDKRSRQIPVQNSNQTLSQSFADLTKFFNYVSQSILDLEEKVANEQRKLSDLDKQVSEHNQTISDQQLKLQTLEQQVNHLELNVSDQLTFNQHVVGTESRVNDSLNAHLVILHELMDRFNEQTTLFDNRAENMNRTIADLNKQFRNLSLSILDSEKKLAQLNASLSGQYGMRNSRRSFNTSISVL